MFCWVLFVFLNLWNREMKHLLNQHVHFALCAMQDDAESSELTYVIHKYWCPLCAHTVAGCAFQHLIISIVDHNIHVNGCDVCLNAVPVSTVVYHWFAISRTFDQDVANRRVVWLVNTIGIDYWFWHGL